MDSHESHESLGLDETASPVRSSLGGIDDAEDAGLLLDEKVARSRKQGRAWRLSPVLQVANAAMFLFSVCWIGVAAYQRFLVSNPLARQLSVYSPLMDKFKLRVQQVETKYSIYDDKASEPATRHPPNAEDDKLWFEWDKLRVIAITREELVRLGRDPETAVRFPSDVGGRGTELYAAGLDAHHYLHCLNRIRQQVYFVYYGQEQARHNWTEGDATLHDIEIIHCIDVLAQVFQCTPNLDVFTYVWLENRRAPSHDFSLRKKCTTNFDELSQWRIDNSITEEEFRSRVRKPEGQKERLLPPTFRPFRKAGSPPQTDDAKPGEDTVL